MFPKTEMNLSRIASAPRSKTKPGAIVRKAACNIDLRGLIRYSIISRIPYLISIFFICLLSASIVWAEESDGKPSGVVPVGSCQPSNAMSLVAAEKQVFSVVPKGSWMAGQNDIALVNVEPYGVALARIPTQKPVSSCASSRTGQTVCTTNDQDVYVFTPLSPAPITLKSSASGTSLFLGGLCMTCGVTMDTIHDKALLSLSLAVPPTSQATSLATSLATSGFQYIDLGPKPRLETAFRSEAPPAFNPGGEISKGILIDPIRNWILSPNESGNFEIIKVSSQKDNRDDDDKNDKDDKDEGKNNKKDNDRYDDTANDDHRDRDHGDRDHGDRDDKTQLAFFENNPINDPVSQFPASFGSAGEDCRTGIALATVEFSDPSEVYIADLTRAKFTPGSPGGWQAPSNFQPLTGSSFPSGPNGIAVAQGTSIGLVAGMSSDSITAIKLPAVSGSGTTPAITDWVTCRLPGITGNGPHTLNAYKSPNSGHAMAVVGNLAATAIWRVDLTQMLNLPRTAHTCNSVFLPPDVLRTIVVP